MHIEARMVKMHFLMALKVFLIYMKMVGVTLIIFG